MESLWRQLSEDNTICKILKMLSLIGKDIMRELTMNKDFREYHLNKLVDANGAALYMEIALEEFERDGDKEAFLMALRDVAQAQGGVMKLANITGLSRTSLYKSLSKNGNPKINTISTVLKGLGLRIKIEPIKSPSIADS